MPALTQPEAVEALRSAVPEFAPAIDEHIAFYGELLLHILFGEFTPFVIDAHARGDAPVEQRSLEYLDRMLREGDEAVDNAVSLSFVENVGPWDPAQREFIEQWPEALKAEAHRQRDWRPPSA